MANISHYIKKYCMLIATKLCKGYCFSHFIHSTKLDHILQRPEVSVLFQVIQA